jgi:hypothetical protein
MKIGKPKYGSDFVPTKYWKLKDGESIYRILPPLGELADDGVWSVFYKVHYGYRNTQGRMRVFQSSLVVDRGSKMVEVPDAAVERIDRLKMELEKAKVSGNRGAIEKLKALLQTYNLDNNHYVNAIDFQGNIGVLKLRHRAKQALDAVIKKLNAQNIDPLSADDGRFFTFTRSGNGLDTTFQVAVAQEEITVPSIGLVKRDFVHRLTPEIIARLGKEARELNKLFKKPTSDEIALIVSQSDLATGRSRGVDEILDTKSGSAEDSDYGDDDSGSGPSGSGGSGYGRVDDSGGTTLAGLPGSSTNTFTGPTSDLIDTTTVSSVTSPPAGFTSDTQAASASAPSAQTTDQKLSGMSEEEFQKYITSLGL